MPYGLYISAEGALAQSQRMEVIANNLANLDTPGFKRELAVFQARYAEAIEQGRDYPGSGSINDVGGGVMPTSPPRPRSEPATPTTSPFWEKGFSSFRRAISNT